MKPRLEAIFFDMGGTLIEFENSSWEVLNQKCAREGYDFLKKQNVMEAGYEDFVDSLRQEFEERWIVSEKTLKEINFEDVVSHLLKKLDLNLTDENKKEFILRYYQPVTDQITLIKGAVEVVRFFKDKNLKVGLISNTIFPRRFHLAELRRFGLDQYLDLVLFSSEAIFKKPHPQIFQTAFELLGAVPDSAVFVGDKPEEDVEGPHGVGMKAILKVKKGGGCSSPIIPDAKINSLTELPNAVWELFDI
jgi:putative hydrolase of the HAD superfamily